MADAEFVRGRGPDQLPYGAATQQNEASQGFVGAPGAEQGTGEGGPPALAPGPPPAAPSGDVVPPPLDAEEEDGEGVPIPRGLEGFMLGPPEGAGPRRPRSVGGSPPLPPQVFEYLPVLGAAARDPSAPETVRFLYEAIIDSISERGL